MKNGLSQEEMARICAVLETIPSVDKAILFGSRAMGLARSNSDVDIMLCGDGLKFDDIAQISSLLDDTTLPYQFDLIRYDVKNPALLEQVKRHGEIIYERGTGKKRRQSLKRSGSMCKWGDLISLEYGKPVIDKETTNGRYPVFGTNGQIGTTNMPPLCPYASVILGRKGAYRGVHYSEKPFSVIDTAFYVKNKTDELDLKWAYYKFLTYDINRMDSGSAIPSTDRYEIYSIPLELPPLDEQRIIANTLSALDAKIANNTKINHHLEQMAQAIFKSWFVDFEPWGGVMPDDWREAELGTVAVLNAGGDKPDICSSAPTNECSIPVFSNGIDNFGLYGYTDIPKVTEESVTVSARGTIGFVCLRQDPFVPIVRLVTAIPNKEFITAKFLYLYLNSIHIAGVGTTQQQLTVPDFKKYRILVPSFNVVNDFTAIVAPMFDTMWHKRGESARIAALRDTLLPRLMSGETTIDIANKTQYNDNK